MCDYSLTHVPNHFSHKRRATRGKSVRHRNARAGTSPPQPKTGLCRASVSAVCVPPGAGLLLEDIPERFQHGLNVAAVEEETFVEQSAETFQYRDAVRFAMAAKSFSSNSRLGNASKC